MAQATPETMQIDRERPLLLVSASPRRRELLAAIGIPLAVGSVAVDEAIGADESPSSYLHRIVRAKLSAALDDEDLSVARARSAAMLVADTIVVLDDEILGKPRDEADARAMTARLAGRAHQVHTRFALALPADDRAHVETVVTQVWFRRLDRAQIARYASTGEGMDKAGAYAIQGIGAMLVSRIEGSHSNVVGLPLAEVTEALVALGVVTVFPIDT
jgi:septum formation protein